MHNLERERGDYMKRQPRVKIDQVSYNFEQYSRYSNMLASATRKDEIESKNFYKIVKYVKKNIDNPKDQLVHEFTKGKGYVPELIEIPEEFEDLPISDVKPKDLQRKRSNRKLIKTHKSKDMTNYDVWRCHDRAVFIGDYKHPNVCKFWVAPADMWKMFGIPDKATLGIVSTGEYNFEDNNLDCFKIYDYKQTDLYHGLNRKPEYYTTPKNLRRPFHKRKRAWPTVEAFWQGTEPTLWKVTADEYADVPRFKRWFRAQMETAATLEKSFEERVLEKYAGKIDIATGHYDEKGVINTKMAAHKLDCSQFMTKEELKEYPHGPVALCVPPKMFDLSKGRRVTTTKEELNLKEQEELARLEEAV